MTSRLADPIADPGFDVNETPASSSDERTLYEEQVNTGSNSEKENLPSPVESEKTTSRAKRSVSLSEPEGRPSRNRARSDAHKRRISSEKGGSSLTPASESEEVSPAMVRVPTFNNKHLYFSMGGPGSNLRKYASEGPAPGGYTLYPAGDPRARRGLPGLFSLVQREDAHADEVGYHDSLFHDEEGAPQRREKTKDKNEKDPNLIVFDGPDDKLNPQNWSPRKKYAQTLILGLATLVVTYASSVFSAATQVVAAEFNVGAVVGTLGTSLFVLGYAVGPLIWGPLSEVGGRKNPLIASYFIFGIFCIPVAVARNIQTIMICRFISGVGASGPLAIAGGALADFWEAEKRGGAIAVFALSTFGGPAIGPIMGSFITKSYLGWRWTMWITLIWSMAMLAVIVFFLDESYVPLLLSRKAKKIRFETKNWAVRSKMDESPLTFERIITVYLTRPLKMLVFEPVLLLLTIYTSFIYGLLYLLFGAVPIEMSEKRGLIAGVSSLPFAAVFVGAFVGACITWSFVPRYNRKMHEQKAIAVPEERMLPMMIGAFIFPIGIFIFGWTDVDYCDSVWPSIIALVLIGCGILLLFMQAINYIIDTFLMHANSALAGNTFARSFFGAGFPLFTTAMFHTLGVQWASTLLGCLAVLMLPIPFLFYRYGKTLRQKSKFAFA